MRSHDGRKQTVVRRLGVGGAVSAAVLLGSVLVAPTASAACTQTGTRLTGTESNDVLCGTEARDILSGRAGDDVLFGGGGNDTLVGGLGSDSLDGGSGDDHLFLRDGELDPVPTCGSGNDSVDMDLADAQGFGFAAAITLGLSVVLASCENITVGAVHEGSNVVISGQTLRVGKAGRTAVGLHCPGSLDIPCKGSLTLAVLDKSKKPRSHPATRYSVRPGHSLSVLARLSSRDQGTLRHGGRATGVITSVEQGHFGNKTTIKTVELNVPH
jgi:hypothetical protein